MSTRSMNTSSMTSNASSFRKRFGFGTLSRENSKHESESRVGNVWRALSKKASTEGLSAPSSLSKSFLSRSRSTDNDHRKPATSRPTSQDRPTSTNSYDEVHSRPGSAHNTVSKLSTIGEGATETNQQLPKKKRRSSLSDLHALNESGITSFGSPAGTPRSRMPDNGISPFQTGRMALRTPSPTKPKYSSPLGSPARQLGSPTGKENSPSVSALAYKERAANAKSDQALLKQLSPRKRQTSQSKIPSPKRDGPARASPPAFSLSPKKSTVSPQKMRIQSPQKVCYLSPPFAALEHHPLTSLAPRTSSTREESPGRRSPNPPSLNLSPQRRHLRSDPLSPNHQRLDPCHPRIGSRISIRSSHDRQRGP